MKTYPNICPVCNRRFIYNEIANNFTVDEENIRLQISQISIRGSTLQMVTCPCGESMGRILGHHWDKTEIWHIPKPKEELCQK